MCLPVGLSAPRLRTLVGGSGYGRILCPISVPARLGISTQRSNPVLGGPAAIISNNSMRNFASTGHFSRLARLPGVGWFLRRVYSHEMELPLWLRRDKYRCPNCDPAGSGKCAQCGGTGHGFTGCDCGMCHATGHCFSCGGTGMLDSHESNILLDWMRQFFGRE
jgi:hypothetical protein